MAKPFVSLYGHVGTAVIIEHPTGVIYSNQAGGTACLQPSIEGALVPFGNGVLLDGHEFLSPERDLCAYFEGSKYEREGATRGIDKEDADFIDGVLKGVRVTRWIEVDRSRLKESCEAWVFVTILQDELTPHLSICSGFGPYPKRGVLTWSNSD